MHLTDIDRTHGAHTAIVMYANGSLEHGEYVRTLAGSTDTQALARALEFICPFASRAGLRLHVVRGFLARVSGSTPVRARSTYASAMAELRDGRSKAAR